VNDPAPPDGATLGFHGAAGTVTGSKHLVSAAGEQVLLDCGLFQGIKARRLRNWEAPPFDARAVRSVVLSHGHLDHSGYLPLLVRRGFRGRIHCTPGTADLLRIVLMDSAHLQEEDTERANRYGYTKHSPALPLYDVNDVYATLGLVRLHGYGDRFEVARGMTALFRRAGHILGSSTVQLDVDQPHPVRLVFSGDLGRWGRPILRDPELVSGADVLMIESTYGDRMHPTDAEDVLVRIISEAIQRGGAVIVPAFAIGRTQELLWIIRKLEDSGRLPQLPVYVDSPMASAVTDIYCRHPEDHNVDMKLLMDEKRCPLCAGRHHVVRTAQESRGLNSRSGPMIIIAGSGMATGGRVLHHLKHRLPDARTTVLLVGFQAEGTRGHALEQGAQEIKIHGEFIPVRARIETLQGLSAHADQREILRWLGGFEKPPARTYVVHGEPGPAATLARVITEKLGWKTMVAQHGVTVPLLPTAGAPLRSAP
jgi:metallo-beta-lactamase family protein